MKNIVDLKSDLRDLEEELQEVQDMKEEDVCIKYNVDEKEEAILRIQEEIEYTLQDIEEQETEIFPYTYNTLSRWAGLTL